MRSATVEISPMSRFEMRHCDCGMRENMKQRKNAKNESKNWKKSVEKETKPMQARKTGKNQKEK
jgi:hypothetical protein